MDKDPAVGVKQLKAAVDEAKRGAAKGGKGKKPSSTTTTTKQSPKELQAQMLAHLLQYLETDEASLNRALAAAADWCKIMLADEEKPRVAMVAADARTDLGRWVKRNWTAPSFLEGKRKARARSQGYTTGPIVLAFYRAEARKNRLDVEGGPSSKVDYISILIRQEIGEAITREIVARSSGDTARFVWGDRIEVPAVDSAKIVIEDVAATIKRQTRLANLRSEIAQARNFFKKMPAMQLENGKPDQEAYDMVEPTLVVSRTYQPGSTSMQMADGEHQELFCRRRTNLGFDDDDLSVKHEGVLPRPKGVRGGVTETESGEDAEESASAARQKVK